MCDLGVRDGRKGSSGWEEGEGPELQVGGKGGQGVTGGLQD